ncbi:hypothetical protein FSP39_016957 [Pinctada imbricata]|uniref:BTB domain-containing protein n=1 Tax=Pinctada imbricata TaxID=66713 RepID=A0AA88YUZ9_PINIB|nr:hypothetical protein FSP39_016957 [Pinctada imbricata]
MPHPHETYIQLEVEVSLSLKSKIWVTCISFTASSDASFYPVWKLWDEKPIDFGVNRSVAIIVDRPRNSKSGRTEGEKTGRKPAGMNGMDIIRLNVGGITYMTTRDTLCKYPDSMIGAMFRGELPSNVDQDGSYFIDRDGRLFQYVLNYLRSCQLALPCDFKEIDLLICEADFYQIQPMIESLRALKEETKAQACLENHHIEIIEVRSGFTATMPSRNSCIKTVLSGRKDNLLQLPSRLIGEEAYERLEQKESFDYVELEVYGSNVRLKLADFFSNHGWTLVSSDLSSSSSLFQPINSSNSVISNIPVCNNMQCIEQSYRDRWRISLPRIRN